jgi:tight adherence protein C
VNFTYVLWRNAFLAVIAVALLLVVYVVAGTPTREGSRLGMRGLKRERALSRAGIFAQVEPLVRWFGVRVSGLVSDPSRANLDKQLRVAGDFLGLTAEEYVGLTVLGAGAGATCGVVAGLSIDNIGVMLLFCTTFGAVMPYMIVSGEGQKRMQRIRHALPHAIDLMTLSMSAGLDFPGAVRQVIEKATDPEDPVIEEFHHILSGLHLGRTRKQALLELADRAPIDSVIELVSAVVQAEERGNPLAQVLAIQAESLRRNRTTRAEEAASRAGVAMAGPLFLLFASIMIIIVAPMILKLQKGM